VGLARAGRAVEQDSALEVLTGGSQPLAVAGDSHDLATQVLERGRRKDQLLGAHGGTFADTQNRASFAEHAAPERHHLAPVDVVLEGELPEPAPELLGRCRTVGDDLDGDR
jgi:hypothetical protein